MPVLLSNIPLQRFDTPNSTAPASGGKVSVFENETSTPAPIFADPLGASPLANPVTLDAAGRCPVIYVGTGLYRALITTALGATIADVSGIQGEVLAAEGGGGAEGFDADKQAITGDTFWRFGPASSRAGAVRLNGRTIGSGASGAAERANDDCEDLFTYLWNNFANDICPVSGGRGGSAASDWAANKTIGLPDLRGKGALGLDTMGNSAANVAQRSTTITTTNGSATATVASATGLAIGMYVVSANVPAGTIINSIVGTTVGLSANATATAAGTATRFSFFRDAEVAGWSAGTIAHKLFAAENPIHAHAGTTNTDGAHPHSGTTESNNASHSHTYFIAGGSNTFDRNLDGATGTALTSATASSTSTGTQSTNHQHTFTIASSGAHNHAFTTDSAGGDLAHNNLQPSVLGCWYMWL